MARYTLQNFDYQGFLKLKGLSEADVKGTPLDPSTEQGRQTIYNTAAKEFYQRNKSLNKEERVKHTVDMMPDAAPLFGAPSKQLTREEELKLLDPAAIGEWARNNGYSTIAGKDAPATAVVEDYIKANINKTSTPHLAAIDKKLLTRKAKQQLVDSGFNTLADLEKKPETLLSRALGAKSLDERARAAVEAGNRGFLHRTWDSLRRSWYAQDVEDAADALAAIDKGHDTTNVFDFARQAQQALDKAQGKQLTPEEQFAQKYSTALEASKKFVEAVKQRDKIPMAAELTDMNNAKSLGDLMKNIYESAGSSLVQATAEQGVDIAQETAAALVGGGFGFLTPIPGGAAVGGLAANTAQMRGDMFKSLYEAEITDALRQRGLELTPENVAAFRLSSEHDKVIERVNTQLDYLSAGNAAAMAAAGGVAPVANALLNGSLKIALQNGYRIGKGLKLIRRAGKLSEKKRKEMGRLSAQRLGHMAAVGTGAIVAADTTFTVAQRMGESAAGIDTGRSFAFDLVMNVGTDVPGTLAGVVASKAGSNIASGVSRRVKDRFNADGEDVPPPPPPPPPIENTTQPFTPEQGASSPLPGAAQPPLLPGPAPDTLALPAPDQVDVLRSHQTPETIQIKTQDKPLNKAGARYMQNLLSIIDANESVRASLPAPDIRFIADPDHVNGLARRVGMALKESTVDADAELLNYIIQNNDVVYDEGTGRYKGQTADDAWAATMANFLDRRIDAGEVPAPEPKPFTDPPSEPKEGVTSPLKKEVLPEETTTVANALGQQVRVDDVTGKLTRDADGVFQIESSDGKTTPLSELVGDFNETATMADAGVEFLNSAPVAGKAKLTDLAGTKVEYQGVAGTLRSDDKGFYVESGKDKFYIEGSDQEVTAADLGVKPVGIEQGSQQASVSVEPSLTQSGQLKSDLFTPEDLVGQNVVFRGVEGVLTERDGKLVVVGQDRDVVVPKQQRKRLAADIGLYAYDVSISHDAPPHEISSADYAEKGIIHIDGIPYEPIGQKLSEDGAVTEITFVNKKTGEQETTSDPHVVAEVTAHMLASDLEIAGIPEETIIKGIEANEPDRSILSRIEVRRRTPEGDQPEAGVSSGAGFASAADRPAGVHGPVRGFGYKRRSDAERLRKQKGPDYEVRRVPFAGYVVTNTNLVESMMTGFKERPEENVQIDTLDSPEVAPAETLDVVEKNKAAVKEQKQIDKETKAAEDEYTAALKRAQAAREKRERARELKKLNAARKKAEREKRKQAKAKRKRTLNRLRAMAAAKNKSEFVEKGAVEETLTDQASIIEDLTGAPVERLTGEKPDVDLNNLELRTHGERHLRPY